MSKLLDKLQDYSHKQSQAIGFRTQPSSSKEQTSPIVVSLSSSDIGLIPDIIAVGIGAILINIKLGRQTKTTLTKISKAARDIPWGISTTNIEAKQISMLLKAGCDFIVFDAATTPASLVEEENIGKILRIEQMTDNEPIEVVGQLPIDAIFIDNQELPNPSIQHLMLCQYLSETTGKPLLFTTPLEADNKGLKSLHQYGVCGIVTKIRAGYSRDELQRIVLNINVPLTKSKRAKTTALLPSTMMDESPLEKDLIIPEDKLNCPG
ncbi:MAG: hypothetical protein J7L90_00160 [Dehalococcoidia bacterium]|nr:hypothetical protein [Dehalococcoidia bacterium]